jgi:hypothetical protein
MLIATLGISSYATSSILLATVFMAMMGGGFALVNIPSAAVVTTLVRTQVLSLAMSVNTMALFAGGSFGMAVLTAILITRGVGGRQPRSIPCIAEREPASVTDN